MASSALDPAWRRIAGLETSDSGLFAMVWLAHDAERTDLVHVYDVCLWRQEVMAVIAEGIGARGKTIPVAWPRRSAEIVRQLLDRGIDTLPEPVSDDPAAREVAAREVLGRLRSKRLRADKRCREWVEEYKSYYRDRDGTPPRDTHPLMAATQHAIMQLDFAQAPMRAMRSDARYPRLPIV